MEPVTWAFIGTIVGALSSIATTSIVNWNNFRIQQSNKLEDRKERSRAFQRETALELQNELIEYMRCHSLSRTEDQFNFVKTGKWGSPLPVELDGRFRISSAKTAVLIERISDDKLRINLKDLKRNSTNCMFAKSIRESDEHDTLTIDSFSKANEMLGVVLRKNY
ncbi:MAG: hypothetical protein COA63_008290 [Methylophaga sp.]|nr:hypothetical protein [Methylophaga sp.]